jgi:hypothetical protein
LRLRDGGLLCGVRDGESAASHRNVKAPRNQTLDKCICGMHNGDTSRETPMRFAVATSVLSCLWLLISIPGARAQSAYDYPWCAIYSSKEGGTQACYYATYAQCRATMDGIGGYCIQSPYYRGPAPHVERRHR